MSVPSDSLARIFLLSHMRACTSLVGHILGSHRQINGYYEMHQSYQDAAALERQLECYREHDPLKENSRYLFDKLLHNDYAFRPEQLGSARLKILMALREPEDTLKSIVNLFAGKEIDDLYASPAEAAKYYVTRLQTLAEFARQGEPPYFYFDAELLKQAPERLLPRLSAWLELDTPLSEHYQTFSQTGKARKGDSSARIHSGKIDRTPTAYAHVALPEALLKEAQAAYRECRGEIVTRAAEAVVTG